MKVYVANFETIHDFEDDQYFNNTVDDFSIYCYPKVEYVGKKYNRVLKNCKDGVLIALDINFGDDNYEFTNYSDNSYVLKQIDTDEILAMIVIITMEI